MPVPSGSDPSHLYGSPLVTLPYVTGQSFAAYPSYAELDNLVTGVITANANNAQLNNMLIQASEWATSVANMPLHGHEVVENKVMRVRRNGVLSWKPADSPVRAVTGLQYAWQLGQSVQTVADLTNQWIEGGAQVNLPFPAMSTGLNGLQLGPPAMSGEIYTTWTYAAGYPHALLAQNSSVGATSIVVSDPTAIMPGDRLRIWEPGVEEACTVAANYGIGSTTVPLNSPLVNAHTTIAAVSGMPSDIMLSVTMYTCALLMRPDGTAEDQFPDTRTGITTRHDDARRDGTGLAAEAFRLLRTYMRVR